MTVDTPLAPPDVEGPPPAQPRWVRPVLAAGLAVVLLLVGATVGMFLRLPAGQAEPGPVDVGFAQDMSVHHLQAVTMAAWERDHTADPELLQLATDMERTQNNQVGQMQGWLSLWDAPQLPIGGRHAAWMTGAAHGHGAADAAVPGAAAGAAAMPGMASTEELARLRAATGPELDVLFLQLMLRHHEGGAAMLRYGAENASVPQVRNLAAQMLSSQGAETDYLTRLLTERGGTPLPL
jgi:uncharacterized protein (DUF305 family)